VDDDLERLERELAQLKGAVAGFEEELEALKLKSQSELGKPPTPSTITPSPAELQPDAVPPTAKEDVSDSSTPVHDDDRRTETSAEAARRRIRETARQSARRTAPSATAAAGPSVLSTAFPSKPEPSETAREETGPLPPETSDRTSPDSEGRAQTFLSAVVREFTKRAFSRFLGPVADMVDRLGGLYRHYQRQGRAPVFLMTVVGLVALTAGFGYGLQYTFTNVLSDALKVAFGFIVGITVIGLGCFIALRKPGYQEYGASVIGLGVVFNYLCAYFVGPYYNLVSEPLGFALLALITAASYVLALVFETRVVAAITLVGGTFSPVLLGNVSSIDTIYVSYLFVLAGANLHLSKKIQWPVLAQLTFLLSLGMLEFSSYGSGVGEVATLTLYLAFFNLFAYYWSFDGLVLRDSLSKTDLGVLTANVFYMLYAVLSAPVNPFACAIVLVLNAGIIAWLIKALRLAASIAGPMYTLMIASLIAGAIFVLAPLDIMGALWAAEGLTLVYVGFRYRQSLIRIEGYAIFAVAIMCLLWQTLVEMSPISYSTADTYLASFTSRVWPWLDLAALGGLFFAAYRIIGIYAQQAEDTELKFARILNETFTFWAVIAQFAVFGVFLTDGILVLAVMPLLWCFYRTARHGLVFAPLVGSLLFGAFVLQVFLGMSESQTRLVSYQPWLSWVAMLELLILGWGIQWWYALGNIIGRGHSFARLLRTLVSLAPAVLLVSSLFYIYETNVLLQLPAAFDELWFDVALATALLVPGKFVFMRLTGDDTQGSQHQLQIVEESISASVSILFLYTLSIFIADWTLVVAAIPFVFLLYRCVHRHLPVTEIMAWGYGRARLSRTLS
jgi:hypothetical protein